MNRILRLVALMLVVCPTGWVAASSSHPWDGTYRDAEITLELKRQANDDFEGVIRLRDQRFPVTAHADGRQLTGAFRSGEGSFDFVATADGDQVNLTTGGKTYQLRKAGVNPLGGSAPPASPLAATGVPPNAKPLHQYNQPDPGFGNMMAWVFNAPADWKMEGGVYAIFQRANTVPTWFTDLRVHSADGLPEYRKFDSFIFRATNNPKDAQAGGAPAKRSMGGNAIEIDALEVVPVMKPEDCIMRIVLPRCRQGIKDVRVIGGVDAPAMTEECLEDCQKAGAQNVQVKSARVLVEYTEHGRPMEEMIFCTVAAPPPVVVGQFRSVVWLARGFSYRAEKGKLEAAVPLLANIAYSMIENPDWTQAKRKLQQRGAAMNAQHARDLADIARRSNEDTMRIINEVYENRQRAQAKSFRAADDNVRGVQRMVNPETGKKLTPTITGDDYYYEDSFGKVHTSNVPPGEYLPKHTDFTPLKRDNQYP